MLRVRSLDFGSANPEEIAALDAISCESEEASVFHSVAWLDFLKRQFNAAPKILLAVDGDTPVGMLPFFDTVINQQRTAISGGHYLGTIYGGPIATRRKEEVQVALLREFGRWPAEQRLLHTVPDFAQKELITARFKSAPSLTAIIDLIPPENEIWLHVQGRCRRSTRKAEREGAVIVDGRQHIQGFARLLEATARANGFSILPGNPHVVYSALCDNGRLGRIFVALLDGRVIGGTVVLLFKQRLYSYLLAVDHAAAVSPSTLLHWESIRLGKAMGCTALDLLGLAAAGPAWYKEQFNATPANFFIATRNPLRRRIVNRIRKIFHSGQQVQPQANNQ